MEQKTNGLQPTSSPALRESSAMTTREDKFSGLTVHQQAEMAAISVAAKERALIEGAYVMAKKFPRNEDDARARILKTCRIFTFAEKAKYKKPIGKDFIIGPSIRLAEEMMRQWGHIRVEGVMLYDDSMRRIIQVSALDLQTGANGLMQFTIEKTVERKNAIGREVISERLNSYKEKISTVVATEDEVLTKQNATFSKYRRNLIFQLMPVDILQDALTQIDKTIKDGVNANPDREKKIVLDNFAKLGILPSEIEKFLGHPLAQLITDEIVELKDVYNTVKDGEDTWVNVLAAKLDEANPELKKETATMDPKPRMEDFKLPSEYDKALAEWEKRQVGNYQPGDSASHTDVKEPAKKQK